MYTLTTSVYDNDGANVQYECGHGNTRYAYVLNMTIESYEYIDNANNFQQLVNNEEDLFSITFKNYTQIPQYSVVYGQEDHSKQLKINIRFTKSSLQNISSSNSHPIKVPKSA